MTRARPTPGSVPLPVTLTAWDAQLLAQAIRAERRATQAAEIAILAARLPVAQAAEAKQALLDELAALYGFNPDIPLAFDPATGTLAEAPPETPAGQGDLASGPRAPTAFPTPTPGR